MNQTELIYLQEMDRLETDATVTGATETDGRWSLILDRTVFYPQGGGQPFDTGKIRGAEGALDVEEVRWSEDGPRHIGNMSGMITTGDTVSLHVDRARRELTTKLHSAGHVVDMAIDRLGLGWVPGKGYHFPEGPYVEYTGSTELDKDELAARIEAETAAILAEDHSTTVRFVPIDRLGEYCRVVPEGVPADKPARVVLYGEFGVACGGTHVRNLSIIGAIGIRKLRIKGDTIRVSYAIDPTE